MANSYSPIADDPGLTAQYQALINGDPPPQPPKPPPGPAAFANRITDPQTYMPQTQAPDARARNASNQSYPQYLNAQPKWTTGQDMHAVWQAAQTGSQSPAAPPQPSQQQDTPPSGAQLGMTAQEAATQVPSYGAGSMFGPGGGIDRFRQKIPVIGGLTTISNQQIGEGPISSMLAGTDPRLGDPRYPSVLPGTPEEAAFKQGRGQQLAAGVIGGGDTKAVGAAANALERFVVRVAGGAEGKPGAMFEVFDNETGKATATSHTTEEAAQARAATLNQSLPAARPAAADVQAAFGDPNVPRIAAAAKSMPDNFTSAIRGTLREGTDLTPDTLLGTAHVQSAIDKALTEAKAPLTDANRLSVAQQLIDDATARNVHIAPRLAAQPLGSRIVARSTEQLAAEAGPSAAAAAQEARAPGAAGAVSDIGTSFDQMVGPAEPRPLPPEVAPDSPVLADAARSSDGAAAVSRATQVVDEARSWVIPGNRRFGAGELGQLFNEVVYNGIVMPTTVLVHGFGSTASSLANFPEQVILSGVDRVLGAVGLTKGRNYTLNGAIGGLNAQIHGVGNAIAHDLIPDIISGNSWVDQDVPREVSTAILRGEYGSNALLKLFGGAAKVAAEGNLPLRTMSAVDNVIRRGLSASDLMRQGYVEAANQGLSGQALHDFAAQFIHDAGPVELRAAEDAAKLQINRQAPGEFGKVVLDVKEKTGVIGTVLLPFFNTRLNILKAATTWSPLGFARLLPSGTPVLGYFTHGTMTEAARIQAVTRAGLGTMALYPIWQSVLSDNITGDGPTDPKAKALWAGDQNNPSHVARAMRTPLGWVTYGKVPVIGDYIAAIADAAQAVKDNKASDVSGAQAAVAGLVQFFAKDEQGLANVATMAKAAFDFGTNPADKQAETALAQNLASRGFEITPYSGMIRVDAAMTDPNYKTVPKDTKDFSGLVGQNFRANFPSNFPLGDTAQMPNGAARVPGVTGGLGSISPVHIAPDTAPAIQGTAAGMPPVASAESTRLAAAVKTFTPIGLPTDKIGVGSPSELKLSGDQYATLTRMVGEQRNTEINTLMASPAYQQAADVVKARMFESAISRANKSGEQNYLRNGVLTSTDPAMVKQEAVLSVHALSNERDRAQWVSLMSQSGKLSSAVQSAIDASWPPTLPGQASPPTVDQYLKAGPLVTKYLATKPYLVGNAQEWAALAQARKNEAAALNAIKQTASNMPTTALTQMARQKLSPQDQQLIQKYSSSVIVNPLRRQMLIKDPWLSRFLGTTTTQAQPLAPPSQ